MNRWGDGQANMSTKSSSVKGFGGRWGAMPTHHRIPATVWERNKTCPCVRVSCCLSLKHLGVPLSLLLWDLLTQPHSLSLFSVLNFSENYPLKGAVRSCPLHSLSQKVVEISVLVTLPVLPRCSPGGARMTMLAEGTAGQCLARTIRKRDCRGRSSRSCVLWPAGLLQQLLNSSLSSGPRDKKVRGLLECSFSGSLPAGPLTVAVGSRWGGWDAHSLCS